MRVVQCRRHNLNPASVTVVHVCGSVSRTQPDPSLAPPGPLTPKPKGSTSLGVLILRLPHTHLPSACRSVMSGVAYMEEVASLIHRRSSRCRPQRVWRVVPLCWLCGGRGGGAGASGWHGKGDWAPKLDGWTRRHGGIEPRLQPAEVTKHHTRSGAHANVLPCAALPRTCRPPCPCPPCGRGTWTRGTPLTGAMVGRVATWSREKVGKPQRGWVADGFHGAGVGSSSPVQPRILLPDIQHRRICADKCPDRGLKPLV